VEDTPHAPRSIVPSAAPTGGRGASACACWPASLFLCPCVGWWLRAACASMLSSRGGHIEAIAYGLALCDGVRLVADWADAIGRAGAGECAIAVETGPACGVLSADAGGVDHVGAVPCRLAVVLALAVPGLVRLLALVAEPGPGAAVALDGILTVPAGPTWPDVAPMASCWRCRCAPG